MSPLRVLYLHGLEETADSPKPAAIAADLRVEQHCPALGIWFSHRNSPLLHAARAGAPVVAAAFVASYLLLGGALAVALSTTAISTVAGILFRDQLVASAVSGSFSASLSVAEQALRQFNPDVIVGFSWGGALACSLAIEGKWGGPILLLAPAHRKMADLMQRPCRAVPFPARSKVVHSRDDQLVPIEHSRALCRAASVELLEVEGEPHKMWGISGRLPEMVLNLSCDTRDRGSL